MRNLSTVGCILLGTRAVRSLEHSSAPSPSGALAIAEIRDASIDALFAFYQDWNVLRVRIRNPVPFLLANPTCFSTAPGTGLLYSINDMWNPALGTYALGPNLCSEGNIDNHFDPTLACGPQSGNPFCTEGVGICPSSANPSANGVYTCDPSGYVTNPYTCEVGDLSGKYGPLVFNINSTIPTLGPTTTSTTTAPTTTTTTTTAALDFFDTLGDTSLTDLLRLALEDVNQEGLGGLVLPGGVLSTQAAARQEINLSNGRDLVFRVVRDRFSPPVNLLQGRSVLLECADTFRIACAKIQFAANVPIELARNEILARLARQRSSENVTVTTEDVEEDYHMNLRKMEDAPSGEIIEEATPAVAENMASQLIEALNAIISKFPQN